MENQKRTEELEKHFSAYVKKAIRNNSNRYINKKSKLLEAETVSDSCSDLPGTDDVMQQVEKISDHFSEGVAEIRVLLEQIGDYHLFLAVTELNELEKDVISLRILYEKPFNEIGLRLGITDTKAENTYFNAIKKIRKKMRGKKYEF